MACLGHRKAAVMVAGHQATWKKLRSLEQGNYIWVHVASLGEFEQGRPLIERIRKSQPNQKILLTFFSPSGYEVRKEYPHVDMVGYLPFDTPWNAWRWVKLLRPSMAIFVKYEFWHNYIYALSCRDIPIYSVSCIFRSQQIYFRTYGWSFARCLRRINHFFVQNEESQRLLATIGVMGKDKVTIVGDTRFDRVVDIQREAKDLPLVEGFLQKDRALLVAGSTWPADEDLLLAYLNKKDDLQAIIAPHVLSEDHLQAIVRKCKKTVVRYSQLAQHEGKIDVLLIDNFGLLSSLYRYATVAYVGGGFGAGIHNVSEAAVYGVPVLIGPHHKKFLEATSLVAKGACLVVRKQKDFFQTLDQLLTDENYRHQTGQAAYDYIHHNAGATDKIYAQLFAEATTEVQLIAP